MLDDKTGVKAYGESIVSSLESGDIKDGGQLLSDLFGGCIDISYHSEPAREKWNAYNSSFTRDKGHSLVRIVVEG